VLTFPATLAGLRVSVLGMIAEGEGCTVEPKAKALERTRKCSRVRWPAFAKLRDETEILKVERPRS